MTYARQWALYNDGPFQGRVAMALVNAAQQVQNEPGSTAFHDKRVRLAEYILVNPVSYVRLFLPYIAANPTISAAGPEASSDGDLDFVVASKFTTVAKSE